MCNIVFEKINGCGGKVNRMSVYAEAPVRRFFKRSVMRNFVEFTRKYLCWDLFFDIAKLCGIGTSSKASL